MLIIQFCRVARASSWEFVAIFSVAYLGTKRQDVKHKIPKPDETFQSRDSGRHFRGSLKLCYATWEIYKFINEEFATLYADKRAQAIMLMQSKLFGFFGRPRRTFPKKYESRRITQSFNSIRIQTCYKRLFGINGKESEDKNFCVRPSSAVAEFEVAIWAFQRIA